MSPAMSEESFAERMATAALPIGTLASAAITTPRISPGPVGGGPAGRAGACARSAVAPSASRRPRAATRIRLMGVLRWWKIGGRGGAGGEPAADRCLTLGPGAGFQGCPARPRFGLVSGNGGVDLLAPAKDSTCQVPYPPETRRLKPPHGGRAALAAPAHDDDLTRPVKGRERALQLTERHQPRTLD